MWSEAGERPDRCENTEEIPWMVVSPGLSVNYKTGLWEAKIKAMVTFKNMLRKYTT